jgi:hypothetical protein
VSEVNNALKNNLENYHWQISPNKVLSDIENVRDIDIYIRNVLLSKCFNTGYLDDINYIVGLRFTIKLAAMEDNLSEYRKAVPFIRKDANINSEA